MEIKRPRSWWPQGCFFWGLPSWPVDVCLFLVPSHSLPSVFVYVQISSSCKDTSHIWLRSNLINSFHLITSVKPLSPNTITFWVTGAWDFIIGSLWWRDTIQDIKNSIQVDSKEGQIWIISCWLHDFQKRTHKKNRIIHKRLEGSAKSLSFSTVPLELSDSTCAYGPKLWSLSQKSFALGWSCHNLLFIQNINLAYC